jgi:hypothetical protein
MTSIVQQMRLALSKGPNRVDVSLPSPEEGNRPILQSSEPQLKIQREQFSVRFMQSTKFHVAEN